MSTKLTFIGTAPTVTTGEDVVNAGPQTPTVADQNIANLRGAVDGKMPLAGTAGAVSFGAVTASGIAVNSTSPAGFIGYTHTINGELLASTLFTGSTGELKHTAGFTGWGGSHTFHTNGIERLQINPSGNVLIGTPTDNGSGAKLQVNGGISASALPVYADNTAAVALVAGTMYRTSTGTVMIKY